MVDQEIRVLGDENIIANPKNSQKQYPLTFKAVPNVIVYGRKKDNLNFTVPIPEGVNFNFNLDRTSIIFSDNFNLEEYSYIMVKNPFEEIQDFFYVSSLEELDPTGKEFNEFNDEVVKWLRRLVNIISNRCMIFETTLFKDLNNFPNIKSGQTFIRTEDGWKGITIRDINSELDLIFNKYVEEVNKKIQEHQVKMNELLEQWKQDIQKYAENVKQYEIVRVVTQTGHGFVFEPVMYSISQRKFVKAVFPHGADGVAVRVDDNNFRLVWAGRVEIPATAKDTQQRDFVLGEYYFLGEGSNGGIQREKPDTYYQHLFQVMYSDELRQNIADVLLSVPINQKGKRWDVGEAKTTVNDIEELKMSDFPVGKVVEVLGYYKAGDGATHKRVIADTDDGSGVELRSGKWANIVKSDIYHSNWFGANKSVDVTDIFEKMISYNKPLIVNQGEYNISKHIFDIQNNIIENNGTFKNKKIIKYIAPKEEKPKLELIGTIIPDSNVIIRAMQGACYNDVREEYVVPSSTTKKDELSVLYVFDKNFNYLRKKELPLDHASQVAFKKDTNEYIVTYDFGYTGIDKHNYVAILNADTLEFKRDINIGSVVNSHSYDNDLNILVTFNWNGCKIFDENFNLIKEITVSGNVSGEVIYQGTAFYNGKLIYIFSDKNYENAILRYFDLNGKLIRQDKYFMNDHTEIEGLALLPNGNLLTLSYNSSMIKMYEFNFIKHSHNVDDIITYEQEVDYYVNSSAATIGDGSKEKPFKTISQAINEIKRKRIANSTIITEGEFNETVDGIGLGKIKINGQNKTIINGGFLFTATNWLWIQNLVVNTTDSSANAFYITGVFVSFDNITINSDGDLQGSQWYKKCLSLYNCVGNILNITINNANTPIYICQGSNIIFTNIKGKNNNYKIFVNGAIAMLENITIESKNGNKAESSGQIFGNVSPAQLNTLYHMEKMKQENVYDDYISYMDEKTAYDKQQRKLEQDRQLAYEEALKENPNLTYDEFMSVQPMTLNLVEEPQPSEALKKFMEKYL